MNKLIKILLTFLLFHGLLVACTSVTPPPFSRPDVKIISPPANSEFQCNKLKLSVSATDTEPLERIEVYVDGDSTYTQSINNAREYNGELLIEIKNCQPGNHLIEVTAINYNGRSSLKQMLQVTALLGITEIPGVNSTSNVLTPVPEIILHPLFNESGIVFSGNNDVVEAQEFVHSTWPAIGKPSASTSVMARGLLSFDISQIKPDIQINSALLRLELIRRGAGLPPETSFAIDALFYGFTISSNAYDLGPYLTPYESEQPISTEIDLTNAVQYAIANKLPRLQLRLYFAKPPDDIPPTEYGIFVDMINTKLIVQRTALDELTITPASTILTQTPNVTQTFQAAFDEVDEQFQEFLKSNIAYTAPKSMKLNETVIIDLLLNPSKSQGELASQIEAGGNFITSTAKPGELVTSQGGVVEVVPKEILIDDLMKAVLISKEPNAFIIKELHSSAEQPINSINTTKWHWLVTAKEKGTKTLVLVISRLIKKDGREYWVEVESYNANIAVEITATQWIKDIDWRWLLTTLLIPLFLWWLNNHKKKQDEQRGSSQQRKRPKS
jgi:hypothetical protein